MSFILDALRRVERDKRLAQQPMIDIKDRLLNDSHPADAGFISRHTREAMMITGLFTFAGALWYMAGMIESITPEHVATTAILTKAPEPAAAPTPAARMAAPEPAIRTEIIPLQHVTLSPDDIPVVDLSLKRMPVRSPEREAKPEGRGMERVKLSARVPASEQKKAERVSGTDEIEEEVSPDMPAGYPPPKHLNKTAGTEPPARQRQAAPAPAFNLDGIIFHSVPANRSALLRTKGNPSSLVKIGDTVEGYTVVEIAQNRLTLAAGERKVELSLE